MIDETILITVKTYPTLSKSYVETVCTAGINDRGEWRRLYPIRFRHLADNKQFKLYDRITVRLSDHSDDGRPESRRPSSDTIQIKGRVRDWPLRHQWVGPTIIDSLKEMIDKGRSIGPIRCREVLDFYWKKVSGTWSPDQLEQLKQQGLWGDEAPKALEKIPYEFHLRWKDGNGEEYDHMFISWEVRQTWRTYRRDYSDPLTVMKDKWLDDILSKERDLAFFMGNRADFRQVFMVCGTYNPPKREIENHESLF